MPDVESNDAKIETLEGLVEKFLKVQDEMVKSNKEQKGEFDNVNTNMKKFTKMMNDVLLKLKDLEEQDVQDEVENLKTELENLK